MNKKKQMNFNVNNFLLAVTDILDTKDIEENNVSKSHSLRVAYVCLKIGEKCNLEPKEMFDLCAYSLFFHYADEKNMSTLGIDFKSSKLNEIIHLIHEMDEKYNFSLFTIENRNKLEKYIFESEVNKKYKDIYLEISKNIDFWMDCQTSNAMLQYIYKTLYDFTEVLTFDEVLQRTTIFGKLYNKEIEIFLDRCKIMIDYYNFEEKDKLTFLVAASMVDFGKLAIDSKILSKDFTLSDDEYEIVKSNIYHNKNALSLIYGFEDITKWATRHQEQLDAKGYPSSLGAHNLSLKDRLMAVLHIYNSLVSNKPFRKKYSHAEAMEKLYLKAKNYRLDEAIVKDVDLLFQ